MSKLTPFGVAMRKLRLDKQLRMLDVANKLDVSAAYLSAIETGRKAIPDGFTNKIARALNLAASELAELGRAKDRTRKEVRVGDHSEEDRELIAAFARRLDDVPDDIKVKIRKIVLKSCTADMPFERKRRGIAVPAVSTQVIRGYAEKVRSAFVPDQQIMFPIIEVLEWAMPNIDPEFVFDIWDPDEMGDDEGRVLLGGHSLILRTDIYQGACDGNERDRFTACHELGHYLMHRKIPLARARADEDKIYCDSEWQADTFAGTLMMSSRHLEHFIDAEHMARECGASIQAAKVMWKKYTSEGLIKTGWS